MRERGGREEQPLLAPSRDLLHVGEGGLVARPLREELRLRAGGADRLDHLQAASGDAGELPRGVARLAPDVGPDAGSGAQEHDVAHGRREPDRGQPRIEVRDEGAVERHQDEIEEHARELAGERRRHAVVGSDATHEIARHAREIEADRQPERVPHELAGHRDAQLHEQLQEVGPLQGGERGAQQGGQSHADEESRQPIVLSPDEHLVDEDHAEDGRHRAGQHEEHAREDHEDDRAFRPHHAAEERRQEGGPAPGRLELGVSSKESTTPVNE